MGFWNMLGFICLVDTIFGNNNHDSGYHNAPDYDPERKAELDDRYDRLSERIDELERRLDDIDPDSDLYDDLEDDIELLRDELDDIEDERYYFDRY